MELLIDTKFRILSVLLVAAFGGCDELLRCFCNLPECAQTSDMCKSGMACFIEKSLNPDDDHPRVRIGCLELNSNDSTTTELCSRLDSNQLSTASIDELDNSSTDQLICCQNDMCNYIRRFDDSTSPHKDDTEPDTYDNVIITDNSSFTPSISDQSWFRIAIIVVPVVGTITFFILVIIAGLLLRSGENGSASQTNSTSKLISAFSDPRTIENGLKGSLSERRTVNTVPLPYLAFNGSKPISRVDPIVIHNKKRPTKLPRTNV